MLDGLWGLLGAGAVGLGAGRVVVFGSEVLGAGTVGGVWLAAGRP